jgi:hypothetical protein
MGATQCGATCAPNPFLCKRCPQGWCSANPAQAATVNENNENKPDPPFFSKANMAILIMVVILILIVIGSVIYLGVSINQVHKEFFGNRMLAPSR